MNRFIRAGVVATVLFGCFASVASAGAPVGPVVDEVSAASYQFFHGERLYAHTGDNRGFGPEHDPARANIFDDLAAMGLSPTLDPFLYNSATYYNVVAALPGRVTPDQVYIVGAHYDSVNNPGADDNASGTAGVLEAARVLGDFPFRSTIVFIAFDREEQGLWGSKDYAAEHAADDIRGMISLDMIAYNPAGADHDKARIYGRASSQPLKDALASAVATYGGIAATILGPVDASDHAPFEWEGFQASVLIEYAWSVNPNYHKAADAIETPDYIDYDYATRMTKAAVGYLATAAERLYVGDATLDDAVDVSDLSTLAGNFRRTTGMTWVDGDFNADGAVDVSDLSLLAGNYRVGTAGTALPEPATVLILAAGWGVVVRARRRRSGRQVGLANNARSGLPVILAPRPG